MTEVQLYAKASQIAHLALGKERGPVGRGNARRWISDEDPLAWWNLTECIVALARASAQAAE
jgi:hypothetical protein